MKTCENCNSEIYEEWDYRREYLSDGEIVDHSIVIEHCRCD